MDIEVQNLLLDITYGPNRSPLTPDEHELALFFGDPRDGGTELTSDGGYVRVTVDGDTDWTTPADGKYPTVQKFFPAPSAAWSNSATHWALIDPVTGYLWDSGRFVEPIIVAEAGSNQPVATAMPQWDPAMSADA
jgi:hypothetical protein